MSALTPSWMTLARSHRSFELSMHALCHGTQPALLLKAGGVRDLLTGIPPSCLHVLSLYGFRYGFRHLEGSALPHALSIRSMSLATRRCA